MKKIQLLLTVFLLVNFFALNRVEAKRALPKKVESVARDGIRYSAPVFSESSNHKQLSGYIQAWDTRANKKLWELKVYDIKYDPGLEKDVQEIYITSLTFDSAGNLIVANEAGEEYKVEPATKKVTKKSGPHSSLNSKTVSKNSILVK